MAFLKNLFGGGVKPDYTGLQIQTATSTLPIPIVWGQTKVGGNVVWYANFQHRGRRRRQGRPVQQLTLDLHLHGRPHHRPV